MKMTSFAIYKHDELQDIVAVRQGVSFAAAIFGFLWALYKKIWWLAALTILIHYLISIYLGASQELIITMALAIFYGLFAQDMWELDLQRKDYKCKDIVLAYSLEEAELKYYANAQK